MLTVFSRLRSLVIGAAGAAMVGGIALATGSTALAQDQSAATAKDVIFARKILMGMVGSNMDELDSMLETGKIDMAEAREHSDNISMLLMVFPHLFPAASNEWKPNVERDPATDTFASPDLWTRFADFYRIATAASKTAYNASRSREPEEFKKYGAELRQACDGCHATFLKPQ